MTAPYVGRRILRCRGRAERGTGPGAATGVISAVVQVQDEARSDGILYRAQGGEVVQGREFAAGRGGNVGERGGAIAPNTRPVETLETQSQLLVEQVNATARAQAAQGDAVVVVPGRGECRGDGGPGGDVLQAAVKLAVGGFAGINGLMGVASDAEEFKVAEVWIDCRFDDDVRHVVEGVVGDVTAGVDRLVDRQIGVDAAIHLVGVVHDAGRG